ncbi:hypothetical protein HMPREF1987_02325 [Peptostreptococcaceae bacterium oral taxon 113 str. W5053]|nr:hypothetical protein HMPREF1987_02325 [Peptostreptococcaceae bacterium oral taxon 113 str. W5053]
MKIFLYRIHIIPIKSNFYQFFNVFKHLSTTKRLFAQKVSVHPKCCAKPFKIPPQRQFENYSALAAKENSFTGTSQGKETDMKAAITFAYMNTKKSAISKRYRDGYMVSISLPFY